MTILVFKKAKTLAFSWEITWYTKRIFCFIFFRFDPEFQRCFTEKMRLKVSPLGVFQLVTADIN